MPDDNRFTFEISLSILNHLGRNLYRSFITVLGEAISNAWDADATKVWIYIDKENDNFVIKDNGIGMSHDDFQDKFLKIGYSKRKEGTTSLERKRPYIGRKGIGKLALLSCSDRITVMCKAKHEDYVGGTIDNPELSEAIEEDLTPDKYFLGVLRREPLAQFTQDHDRGTIICFEGVKEGIRSTLDYLKKTIALYFRFSLIDDSFDIYVDGDLVTLDHLSDLADSTEFLWRINNLNDPYVDEKLTKLLEEKSISSEDHITGFIASVVKPGNLTIRGTKARVTVDLFVNGRLRERDILKHIPTARIPESYFYGQIHFNELDEGEDRFTSSRESIMSDDPMYRSFLENLRKLILKCVEDWDKWRVDHKKDGDPDNKRLSKKDRKSAELFNIVSSEYTLPKGVATREKVNGWVSDLGKDAMFNFGSYADCFVSENLIRTFIKEEDIALSNEAKEEIDKYKQREHESKQNGNVSIDLRRDSDDLSYLAMADLANMVDKRDRAKKASLSRDAYEYKPMRDALMHTALLTMEAKQKLNSVYKNIQGRVTTLLSSEKSDDS